MIFLDNNRDIIYRVGDRVVCTIPGIPEKERCGGVVARISPTHSGINDIVVALDYPLNSSTRQAIAEELKIAPEHVLEVDERVLRKVDATNQRQLNNYRHALFCCKSCGRIACKIDLIDFSGFLVCKGHFCPWDSVNHGPNVQEVAELYCRILDIAERRSVDVLFPEAKALMFHGEYLQVLARATNREADAAQDLSRFLNSLLQRERFAAKLVIMPNNTTVVTTWEFEFLQKRLVGEDFLTYFHSLVEKHTHLYQKAVRLEPPRLTSKPNTDRFKLIVISPFLSRHVHTIEMEQRTGVNFDTLWNKLVALDASFRRDQFDVFICQDNKPLLYGQQRFCLPLQDVEPNQSENVNCLNGSTLQLKRIQNAPVSPPQLLFVYFKDIDTNVQTTSELALFYQGFRRIRGDGNCYYRAVMFSFVEQVLSQAEPHRGELLRGFVEMLRMLGGQESLIDYFGHYASADATKSLSVQDFLVDLAHRKPELDWQLVFAAKALLTKFILEHRHLNVDGRDLEEVMMSCYGYTTLEEYCPERIEKMYEHAEGAFVELGLLFTILGCNGALVMLFDNDQRINMRFYESSSASRVTVHLLFRPGHYDLLYPSAETTFQILREHFQHSDYPPLCPPAPRLNDPSSPRPLLYASAPDVGDISSASGDKNIPQEDHSTPKNVSVCSSLHSEIVQAKYFSKEAIYSCDLDASISVRSVWAKSMAENAVFVADSSSTDALPCARRLMTRADAFLENYLKHPSNRFRMPHDDVYVLVQARNICWLIPASHVVVMLILRFVWPVADSSSTLNAALDSSIRNKIVARKLCLLDLSKLQSPHDVEEQLRKHFQWKAKVSNIAVLHELFHPANRLRWPPLEIELEEIEKMDNPPLASDENVAPVQSTLESNADLLKLNVICPYLPRFASIELRAGLNLDALWNKLVALDASFRRDQFDVFICQDNEPLLYGQQRFCLPLQDVDPNQNENLHCIGVSSLFDGSTLQLERIANWPVSPPQLFCTLIRNFESTPTLVQKANTLEHFYQGFRRIRGDGNCYYRAVMFSFVEQVLSQAEPHRGELLRGFVATLGTLGGQESLIDYFGHYTSADSVESLSSVQDFLVDLAHRKPKLDVQLVSAAKRLLMKFILEHRHFNVNELGLGDAMMSYYNNQYTTLEECCHERIVKMGEYAEGVFVELGLLFTILGCNGALVMLNDNDQRINMRFYESSSASRVTVHLLFRPGHYDLLYSFPGTTFQILREQFQHSDYPPLCPPAPRLNDLSSPRPLLCAPAPDVGDISSASGDDSKKSIPDNHSSAENVSGSSTTFQDLQNPSPRSIFSSAPANREQKIRLHSLWSESMVGKRSFIVDSSSSKDLPCAKKMKISANKLDEIIGNPSERLKMPHNDVNVVEEDNGIRWVISATHALVILNVPHVWSASDSSSDSSSIGNEGFVRKQCLLDLSKLESLQAVQTELSAHFNKRIQVVNSAELEELFQPVNRKRWPPYELKLKEINQIAMVPREKLLQQRIRIKYNSECKVINIFSKMSFEQFWQRVSGAFRITLGDALLVKREKDGQRVDVNTFEACLNEALAQTERINWQMIKLNE